MLPKEIPILGSVHMWTQVYEHACKYVCVYLWVILCMCVWVRGCVCECVSRYISKWPGASVYKFMYVWLCERVCECVCVCETTLRKRIWVDVTVEQEILQHTNLLNEIDSRMLSGAEKSEAISFSSHLVVSHVAMFDRSTPPAREEPRGPNSLAKRCFPDLDPSSSSYQKHKVQQIGRIPIFRSALRNSH